MSSLLSNNKDEPGVRKTLSDCSPASTIAPTNSLRVSPLSHDSKIQVTISFYKAAPYVV